MYIKADINDPKVRAEIKDGTLEWRLKSVTLYNYIPNEAGEVDIIYNKTFTDNDTLKNSPEHPIVIKRPIGQWGRCATWRIVASDNPDDDSSTVNRYGDWDIVFNIEFRGEHKNINDCTVQANTENNNNNNNNNNNKPKTIKLMHYLGMVVDNYAVEGTNDVLGVQFGVTNKNGQSEVSINDPRKKFLAYYEIDWATDNKNGLVEDDFERTDAQKGLSIFRSELPISRYDNSEKQYSIELDCNKERDPQKTVTANFFLKAGISSNTESKLIEKAMISIMNYPHMIAVRQIKYYPINNYIQENLGTNNPHGTEGRYLVSESEINVIKATTLFGGKNNSNITGIRQGHPDAPADNGINLNDVIQGGIGDCYFLACLMALAKDSKGFIRTHLTEENNVNEPPKYKLKVYDRNKNEFILKFQIDSLFTHGISQAKLSGDYDDSNNQKRIEIWPQVYEKALVTIKEKNKNDEKNGKAKTFGDISGGLSSEVWPLITGKEGVLINIENERKDRKKAGQMTKFGTK